MIYILLPTYNEALDLPELLTYATKVNLTIPCKIIIINDGSNDDTDKIANSFLDKLPLEIINHKQNMGLGKALASGFKYLSEKITNNDVIITMDADGTHNFDTIRIMVDKIIKGSDVVIASRFCKESIQRGVPIIRKILSLSARLFLSILKPIPNIKDYTSGFRAFSGKIIIEMIKQFGPNIVEEKGFSATFELLMKAATVTNSFQEIPFNLEYYKKRGSSKMKVIKTIFRYIFVVFKTRYELYKS